MPVGTGRPGERGLEGKICRMHWESRNREERTRRQKRRDALEERGRKSEKPRERERERDGGCNPSLGDEGILTCVATPLGKRIVENGLVMALDMPLRVP
jgi:hypothetical protein